MKKLVLTIGAVAGLAVSGYSQGQVDFENGNANGFVAVSSLGDTSGAGGTYTEAAPSFTTELWALTAPASNENGLAGIDAYGFLNPADLVSDGFVELATSGDQSNVAGSAGAFGPVTMLVPGVSASETVFAVVAWTSSATTFAAADVVGDNLGILTFVNDTAGAPPSGLNIPADDIATGWNSDANSPRSAAEGGSEDLIMSPVTATPEPATLALAGLGGLSVLLFRRRK